MKKILYILGGVIILIVIIVIVSGGERKETTLEQQLLQEQIKLQETSQTLQKEQKESAEKLPITENQSQEQTQPKLNWHNVISFQGKTGKTTETFKISSNEWRIKWSYRVEDYGGFTVWLKKPSDKNYEDLLVADSSDIYKSDITYIYEGNSMFYFDINAINDGWIIEVEEKK